jgi:hypothetical protein
VVITETEDCIGASKLTPVTSNNIRTKNAITSFNQM